MVEHPSSKELKQFSDELSMARGLVGGLAAPADLINSDNFPMIAKYAPDSLDTLARVARKNRDTDLEILEVRESHPEIWRWPVEDERVFLLAALKLGMLDEAFKLIKKSYVEKMANENYRGGKVGLGATINGNNK